MNTDAGHTPASAPANGYYIGLISGTSMDAVDAALVQVVDDKPQLLHTLNYPYPPAIREQVLELLHQPEAIPYGDIIQMELALADLFAAAVKALLQHSGIPRAQVRAIGCHGQTLCHRPDAQPPYTVQLGDNARLAVRSGIAVVGDFRRADLAAGGQGAPLASLLHHALFSHPERRVGVLNIGGIANLTVLPPQPASGKAGEASGQENCGQNAVLGFDTGPGNGLMDEWCQHHLGRPYDHGGAWAAGGQVQETLLRALLSDPYFSRPAPKSTGREVFNLHWARGHYPQLERLSPQDVQATLLELSAHTMADAVLQQQCQPLYVCGGGTDNPCLMQRLEALLPSVAIATTASGDLAPEWVEATLFAWLAWRHLNGRVSDLTGITGSDRPRILGAHWPA